MDIGSTEPGIVTSHVKSEIMRRKLSLPDVVYEGRASRPKICLENIEPTRSREEALLQAIEREKKSAAATQRQARRETCSGGNEKYDIMQHVTTQFQPAFRFHLPIRR